MDEDDARARNIALANLRVEVSTLAERVSGMSISQALASIRRTVVLAAILLSVALVASSAINAWASREIRDLRSRVEVLERSRSEIPSR
jgi:hypothetical protein